MCEKTTTQGESFTSVQRLYLKLFQKCTASHDYITKLDVYQRFGVLEYNIVEQEGYSTIFINR